MADLKIDELNTLNQVFDYQDYIEHYFDPMQISKSQRKKRQELAEELMDIVLYFLMWCEKAPEKVQSDEIQRQFQNEFKEKVFGYAEPSTFFDNYIPLLIAQIIENTIKHLNEEYYTSVERAALIGCNEANTVIGHTELENAKALGKKWKVWRTELDEKVRPTHQDMEGVVKPIDEPFSVGNSLMMIPHDSSLGADANEIVNCRCVCEYK